MILMSFKKLDNESEELQQNIKRRKEGWKMLPEDHLINLKNIERCTHFIQYRAYDKDDRTYL